MAASTKIQREELEVRRAEQAETRIQEAIKERKNNEIRQFNLMSKLADLYDKAQRIRRYIDPVEQTASNRSTLTQEVKDWISWARQKADWFDPSIQQPDELLTQEDIA